MFLSYNERLVLTFFFFLQPLKQDIEKNRKGPFCIREIIYKKTEGDEN